MRRGRPKGLFGPSGADQRKAQDGCQNGQQWLAARREQVGHIPSWSMWHDFATYGLRSVTGAPYKGAHDQPTSPAFQATSPIRGGITTNDIAEGDKPRATNH